MPNLIKIGVRPRDVATVSKREAAELAAVFLGSRRIASP
jgi:hypothetical protein